MQSISWPEPLSTKECLGMNHDLYVSPRPPTRGSPERKIMRKLDKIRPWKEGLRDSTVTTNVACAMMLHKSDLLIPGRLWSIKWTALSGSLSVAED